MLQNGTIGGNEHPRAEYGGCYDIGGEDYDTIFRDGDDNCFGDNGNDWVDGDAGYDRVGRAMLDMSEAGWFSAGSDWDWNVDDIYGEWNYDDRHRAFLSFRVVSVAPSSAFTATAWRKTRERLRRM